MSSFIVAPTYTDINEELRESLIKYLTDENKWNFRKQNAAALYTDFIDDLENKKIITSEQLYNIINANPPVIKDIHMNFLCKNKIDNISIPQCVERQQFNPSYSKIDDEAQEIIIKYLKSKPKWRDDNKSNKQYTFFMNELNAKRTISKEEIYGIINAKPAFIKDLPMRVICKTIGIDNNPIPECAPHLERIDKYVVSGGKKTRPYKNTPSSSKPRKSTRIRPSRFAERVLTKSKRKNQRKTRKNKRRNNLRR